MNFAQGAEMRITPMILLLSRRTAYIISKLTVCCNESLANFPVRLRFRGVLWFSIKLIPPESLNFSRN
jgi:hypothetical protein